MKSSQKKDVSGRDLLIVGPGVLGGYLGKLWKDQYPDARVVGQSNTTNSHARCCAQASHSTTMRRQGLRDAAWAHSMAMHTHAP